MKNTISYYKIVNYKNEGAAIEGKVVDGEDADLMEVVIVRLDGAEVADKGLMNFLYGIFSGNKENVISYLPESDDEDYKKEVSDMLSILDYVEEKGIEKGIEQGIEQGIEKGERMQQRKTARVLFREGTNYDVIKMICSDLSLEELEKIRAEALK